MEKKKSGASGVAIKEYGCSSITAYIKAQKSKALTEYCFAICHNNSMEEVDKRMIIIRMPISPLNIL